MMFLKNKNNYAAIGNLIFFTSIILMIIYWTSDLKNTVVKKYGVSNVTGLILARCGSKGIPMKNIVQLNGKSLLENTLLVMQDFGKFDSIWVSTDCQEIADNAKNAIHNVKIHWRDPDTATDTTSSLVAVTEFQKKHPDVQAFGLVQCTSPFINKIWLQKAYDMMTIHRYDSVFSAVRQHKLLWESAEDGTVRPINFDPYNRPRRQDWSGLLIENGMFYFTHVDLIKKNLLQGGRIGVVEIPIKYSIEIDSLFDLKLAQKMVTILN